MTLRRIEKPEWTSFCEVLSTVLPGKRAEIEVASTDLGVQIEAHWLPVIGVTYDPRGDAFDIVLDGMNHMIFNPREVYAEYGIEGIESIAIVDERAWQIVMLRTPLMLAAPHVQG
ncbi:MAG: DUF5335 family protein [Steroidobacteraceae bacterium]